MRASATSRRPDTTLRRAADILTSQLLRLGIGALTGVLLARALAPESRGLYAVVATTAAVTIQIGHLSLQKSQIALWPEVGNRRALLANAIFLSLALGLVCAAGSYAVGLVLPLAPPALLAIALLAVPFGVATINLGGMLLLQSRQLLVNRAGVLTALTQCVPLLILMALDKVSVTAVITCLAVSIMVPFVLFLVLSEPLTLRWEVTLARRQIGLGARYHLGHISLYLLITVDVLLVNALASTSETGFYTVAVSVLALAAAPADAVRQLSLARQADADRDYARLTTIRALRLALLTTAAMAAALAAASPFLIPLVYGPAYAPSVAPLIALAPGAVLLALIKPVEQFLVRLSRPMTMTAIAVIALVVNLGLNAVLIPRWGALGASLAATAAYAVMVAIELTWFLRASRTNPRELVPRLSDLPVTTAKKTISGRSSI